MIHVLIERRIADGMASTYEEISRQTLHLAFQAPGFINGETFTNIHDHNRRYVMSRWRTVHDWNNWASSEARQDVMNALNPTLEQPETFIILEN